MLSYTLALLIQQLEQGCPTLFLEICPVGFHSNPNKAHLIKKSRAADEADSVGCMCILCVLYLLLKCIFIFSSGELLTQSYAYNLSEL